MKNACIQYPITSNDNVVFNYLNGVKIRDITRETEAITNGYDGSLITAEPFLKTAAAPIYYRSWRDEG